jgi:hypothetical protein
VTYEFLSIPYMHVDCEGYEPIYSGECKRKIKDAYHTNILADLDFVVIPVKICDGGEVLLIFLLCL